jgi:hypothetical protein
MKLTKLAKQLLVIPRRPYYDDKPDGYMEGDKDFVMNNIKAAVALLNAVLDEQREERDHENP